MLAIPETPIGEAILSGQIARFFYRFARSLPIQASAMVVKIRLARFGRRNSPFYNIVVAHARCVTGPNPIQPRLWERSNHRLTDTMLKNSSTARNSRPLEVIGTYDPIPKPDPYDNSGKLHKDIKLDSQRARYWIGVGAQPTDTAWRLLSMVGILPKKHFAPKEDESKGSVKAGDVRIR